MANLPARTELVDTYPNPTTSVFKTGLGKLYDWAAALNITGSSGTTTVAGNATFSGNGTNRQTADFTNTGGQLYVGSESSTGSAVFTGSSAYAGVVGTNTNTNLQLATNGAVKATLDASGNWSLGITPSAWGFGGAMDMKSGAALSFGTSGGVVASNAYYDGAGWKYKGNSYAVKYDQQQNLGYHSWYTAPSGTAGNAITFTQAMTLDASGNLSVGAANNGERIGSYTAGTGDVVALRLASAVATGANGMARRLQWSLNDAGGALINGNSIRSEWVDAGAGVRTAKLVFTSAAANAQTDAMTLDASGNLLVGTTSTGYVNANSVSLEKVGYSVINHINGTAGGSAYVAFGYNGAGIGSITQNGTTAVSFNTTSDHRLKNNVRPADAKRFMDIRFVDFEWIDGRHDCGVIAHELQAIYPDLVIGEKDATEVRQVEITPAVKDEEGNEITPAVTEEQTFPKYQQVNYIGLIGRMGTVIQRQQRMLEDVIARLAALEAK